MLETLVPLYKKNKNIKYTLNVLPLLHKLTKIMNGEKKIYIRNTITKGKKNE